MRREAQNAEPWLARRRWAGSACLQRGIRAGDSHASCAPSASVLVLSQGSEYLVRASSAPHPSFVSWGYRVGATIMRRLGLLP